MNSFIRCMTAAAATGALFLAPVAMAKTPHHTKTHHAVSHKESTKSKTEEHKAATTHKRTAQQEKMAQCAHQSKGLKGKAHSDFMSKCLKK